MGYTHYFGGLQPDENLAQAAREIVAASDAPIFGADGYGEPTIEADLIALNGNAETGEDHESFYLRAGDYDFNFCKTARKPYDKVVSAILLYAMLSGTEGAENIRSDGDIVDWIEGVHLYEQCFGRLGEDEFARVVEAIGEPKIYDEENGEWKDLPVPLDSRDKLEDTAAWLAQC